MSCRNLTNISLIGRLDPRLKILAALFWSFLLALTSGLSAAGLGLAFSLLLAVWARLSPAESLRRLAAVNVFILFMWLILPFSFSSPGTVVASLGFLEITREGLDLSLLLTLKANGVALGAMALLGSSPPLELAAAARSLGAPEKLTAMFLLMIRYFQVIHQEYGRLRVAMRARGFKSGLNSHSLRSLANLVGMLLVRSVDRAERVHAAMLCRGYNGRFWIKDDFSLRRLDLVMAGLMLLMMSGVLVLNVAG
jgi:cobalt ABC transporter, permease protein CbiQ